MKRILITTASIAAIQCGSVFAADLPSTKAPPPVLATPSTWTGAYIGINGGYGGNDLTFQSTDYQILLGTYSPGAISTTRTARVGGAVAGGQIGYNYVLSNHVLVGGEFDFDWSDMKGKDYINSTGGGYIDQSYLSNGASSQTAGLNWIGTARLRLGYEMGALLPYVTGGVAFGQASYSNSAIGLTNTYPEGFRLNGNNSSISPGWAVGAGLEYKLANNWSFKTEYLYTQIGGVTANDYDLDTYGQFRVVNITISQIGLHQVRVGINYHPHFFDAPVMAKY